MRILVSVCTIIWLADAEISDEICRKSDNTRLGKVNVSSTLQMIWANAVLSIFVYFYFRQRIVKRLRKLATTVQVAEE